jgi:hypothetical protein
MDLLTRQRGEVGARLDALRAETGTLELADAALAGADADAVAEARATLGLDRGRLNVPRPAHKRGPVAEPGSRRAEVLAVVKANRGIEARAIAAKVGIASTHVYGPLKKLADAGEVIKKGREWLAAPE